MIRSFVSSTVAPHPLRTYTATSLCKNGGGGISPTPLSVGSGGPDKSPTSLQVRVRVKTLRLVGGTRPEGEGTSRDDGEGSPASMGKERDKEVVGMDKSQVMEYRDERRMISLLSRYSFGNVTSTPKRSDVGVVRDTGVS